jgi:hypothetical protein
VGRYRGYLALARVVVDWVEGLKVVIILVLPAAALGYFLLQAPVWCGRSPGTGGCAATTPPAARQAQDDLEATVTTVTPLGNKPIGLRKALTSTSGAVCESMVIVFGCGVRG